MNPSEIGLINAPTLRTNPYKNHFQSQFLLIGSFSVTTIHHVSIIFSYVSHGFLRKHHPAPMVFTSQGASARCSRRSAWQRRRRSTRAFQSCRRPDDWMGTCATTVPWFFGWGWMISSISSTCVYIYILTVIVYYIHTLIWCKLT